jgi:hypothetical protein
MLFHASIKELKLQSSLLFSGCLACVLLMAGPAFAGRASADPPDAIGDGSRALIAKERSRRPKESQETSSAESDRAHSGRKGGCNMDVGNNQGRPGQINSKPTPVIITGPVVQMCN